MEDSPIGGHAIDSGSDPQRRDERDSLLVLARLKIEGDAEAETVRVRNVSTGGLMAQAPEEYRPGVRVVVELDGIGTVAGSVAWAESGRIGVAFDHPIDKARARKAKLGGAEPGEKIYRPRPEDYRRPALKPR